mmetsp:Transcript_9341/g.34966  ORF Transcript_9341/g.34966 Transcript_9341/m.34966 type:complete len:348 (+) Transcript_9341:2989-4032(+)
MRDSQLCDRRPLDARDRLCLRNRLHGLQLTAGRVKHEAILPSRVGLGAGERASSGSSASSSASPSSSPSSSCASSAAGAKLHDESSCGNPARRSSGDAHLLIPSADDGLQRGDPQLPLLIVAGHEQVLLHPARHIHLENHSLWLERARCHGAEVGVANPDLSNVVGEAVDREGLGVHLDPDHVELGHVLPDGVVANLLQHARDDDAVPWIQHEALVFVGPRISPARAGRAARPAMEGSDLAEARTEQVQHRGVEDVQHILQSRTRPLVRTAQIRKGLHLGPLIRLREAEEQSSFQRPRQLVLAIVRQAQEPRAKVQNAELRQLRAGGAQGLGRHAHQQRHRRVEKAG